MKLPHFTSMKLPVFTSSRAIVTKLRSTRKTDGNKKRLWSFVKLLLPQFAESKAADKCKALKSQILATSLQIHIERHIPINIASRMLVNYKNFEGLELTAYEVSHGELKTLNSLYPQAKRLAFIQKLTVAKKWEASIKNEKDYQQHSTEILLPPLKNGQYVNFSNP